MYQVLQVYTSFSFFDNFLSRSIKVGQSSSRRRRLRVAETSPRRCGDVVATFSQSFGLEQVSETSRRRRWDVAETSLGRRGDVFLLENIFSRCDVAATSPRPTGDLKKSPKSRRKNRTCLISLRLPRDPPNLQETSRRRVRDPRRLESPTGRQLVSMPVR